MYGGQEVTCGFVVAGCDCAKELEFGKEVFDQVSSFVEFPVVIPLHLTVGFWGYDCGFARLLQGNQDPLVGIEAFVGKHDVSFNLRQQHIRPIQIAGLTSGEMKANRVAQGIDRGMNLGAQSAFTASDGLIGAPFFSAPALCWWARTMVASIIAYSLSASEAKC